MFTFLYIVNLILEELHNECSFIAYSNYFMDDFFIIIKRKYIDIVKNKFIEILHKYKFQLNEEKTMVYDETDAIELTHKRNQKDTYKPNDIH